MQAVAEAVLLVHAVMNAEIWVCRHALAIGWTVTYGGTSLEGTFARGGQAGPASPVLPDELPDEPPEEPPEEPPDEPPDEPDESPADPLELPEASTTTPLSAGRSFRSP